MRPLALLLALALAAPALAQASAEATADADTVAFDPAGHFAVYAGTGAASGLDALVAAMAGADVVVLGEQHDDPTAHALEARLLEAAHRRYGAARPVALSLEMVERDAQLVLDEYLGGLIREQDFLAASRPWGNYAAGYRPAVEYAKAHGLPVIAANAPSRYVSRVGREGLRGLDALAPEARPFLPPLPVAPASDSMAARFAAEMEGMMAAHGGNAPDMGHLLAAQNLRDATMAYSIGAYLDEHPGALVVQLNGAFHSEDGFGVPEQLARYAPEARVLVVTMRPSDDLAKAPDPDGAAFVVLTDATAISER